MHRSPRGAWFRLHRKTSVLLAVLLLLTPVWWSAGSAMTDPGMGMSIGGRLASWFRAHGGASIVVWAENEWYSHHPPPVGGKPAKGSIVNPLRASTTPPPSAPPHLAPPAPLVPFATPALPGEGQWLAVGRTVGGLPAVYETRLRPDAVHTSVVVGVAWMDTRLLSATLYSGSNEPGGTGWHYTAPVSPADAMSLVAAFNGGFHIADSQGGYYSEGRMAAPLRVGAASLVIYRDGSVSIGTWGQQVSMTPEVASVRQNLVLLVDNGQPAGDLNSNDTTVWGNTLGNQVSVWRSGLGITADGALVYVGGPYLNITDLANLLIRAGAVRAMELDINTDWVDLATYAPPPGVAAAAPSNGTDLLPDMVGTPARYFDSWWAHDFITMSARSSPTH